MGAGIFWLITVGVSLYLLGRDTKRPKKGRKKRKTATKKKFWRIVERGSRKKCDTTATGYRKRGRSVKVGRLGDSWVAMVYK